MDDRNSSHRYTRSYSYQHDDEDERIAKKHLQRLAQGRDSWNQWNKEFKTYIKDNNVKDARIDLTDCEIEHSDFSGYQFSCDVYFTGATFLNIVNFSRAEFFGEVDFRKVHFLFDVDFYEAALSGNADFSEGKFDGDSTVFNKIQFLGGADFRGAEFNGDVFFHETKFSTYVGFDSAEFHYIVEFCKAQFCSDTRFNRAQFLGIMDFSDVKFCCDADFEYIESGDATFNNAHFCGTAAFHHARFLGDTGFKNVKFSCGVNFRNALFSGLTEFNETQFEYLILERAKFENEIPNFLYVTLKAPSFLSNTVIPDLGNSSNDNVLKYRALKGIAIDSHDHEKEIELFGYEIKAKRGIETKGISKIPGYLYQWLSNFGQSLWRPISLICITWLVMYVLTTGNIYHYDFPKLDSDCPDFSQDIGKLREYGVRYISFTAIPFYDANRQSQLKIINCLFNDDIVPLKYKGFGLFHRVITLIGLFLFGLALRNRYKIK